MNTFSSILTHEFLLQHYVELEKSQEAIAQEVGCSSRTISKHLRRFGIETRQGRFQKGRLEPRKGKTKETDPVLARVSETLKGRRYSERSGANHHNWKGGASNEARRVRNSADYLAWRTAVFQRDDYTCQRCGQRGGHVQAHHIEEFALAPEKRLDVANGATLCKSCHFEVHPDKTALKGKPKSETHKAKLRGPRKRGWKRGPMSEEQKRKVSEAKKGTPAWNKGLTKETSEGVARMAETNRKRMTGKTGKENPVWKRWHPDQAK